MNNKLMTLILAIGIGTFSFAAGVLHKAGDQLAKLESDSEVGIIFFKGTWKEALAEAKKEKKLIFMDAYATWCGPCKLMSKNTFTDSEVGKLYNKHFINYKMDMENDPEGNRLSNKYALKAYPTLFFIDQNEEVFHSAIGYYEPADFIELGNTVLEK